MKKSLLMLACLLWLAFPSCNPPAQDTAADTETVAEDTLATKLSVSTIAFGSCSRQDRPQVLWPAILENQPDMFLWLGDNIYGDTEDMELMKAKYDQQKSDSGYQAILQNVPLIYGIWDDHDYGVNDGGKEYPMKAESRDLMLEFLDVPKSDPVWSREGGYQAYSVGEAGKKVKVMLLDARYFRDSLKVAPKGSDMRYLPTEGDILGEEQWAWLEEQLTDSDAEVHLIASGIQFIPEEHGWEKWANFPESRQRLFDLLAKTQPKGVIFMSGDRHIAEVSKLQPEGMSFPLYEVTSSGLTHTWSKAGSEPNQHRLGELIVALNFGVLRIDWDKQPLEVTMEIRGEENALLLEQKVILNGLKS